tara:strand:+ start:125 stop:1450 length:1326 start_codon:yes stop_codon:yes gene_type:complete
MSKRLTFLLIGAAGVALLQQQMLLRRPPRLLNLISQPLHSGSAGLDLQFSRPMDRASIAATSRMEPAMRHRWLGEGNALRLVIEGERAIEQPLLLHLAGSDLRNQKISPQTWWWDPRPWLVVNRLVTDGEQLQLQRRDGTWQPLTPVWPAISQVVPLGNSRGIAVVSSDSRGQESIWLRPLKSAGLHQDKTLLSTPQLESLEPLASGPLLFGHVSSNLSGDLLVQKGGFRAGSQTTELVLNDGSRRSLRVKTAGPLQLIPAGGGMVVPDKEGLRIDSLSEVRRSDPQILPGSRELGAFCSASGRAVLIRHWPDYRRSIELVIPGLAPRQLHLGDQAVLAVACNNAGTRIWAVLGRWSAQGRDQTIVLMDETGQIQHQTTLNPWMLQPGTKLLMDPVRKQLLMSVSKSAENLTGIAALMDADALEWSEFGNIPIKEAVWLMP